MKKTLAILLAFLMVLAMCAGAIADEKLYIPVVSKGFQHQFWQTVYAGAQKAAEEEAKAQAEAEQNADITLVDALPGTTAGYGFGNATATPEATATPVPEATLPPTNP